MSYADADKEIAEALSDAAVSASCSPDLRNRDTDIPAVVWALADKNPSESSTGTIPPYHARYEFDCLALSRLNAERLADEVIAALQPGGGTWTWETTRENNRSSDVIIRGADKTPVYVSSMSVTLTFGD
tara:strand:+ start:285 stop:671 length:387 start_codon:yes stop_codon:yes gene_type:complete